MHYRWEEYYSEPQLRAMKETGVLTERRESGERRRFEIEEQVLRDFAEFDQPAVLSAIRCPVLIVHGDADEEERQLLELSRRGLPYLPRESRLEVIPGADHSFLNHYDQVISLGVSWLSQFSPNE
jgi:pimeloyl-ACP methyl ester carboxylesterase